MLADVHNQKTGRRGRIYVCNGCGGRTRILKADAPLPGDWTKKTESQLGPNGEVSRKRGLVVNYYCYLCTHDGINAWVIGRILRGRSGRKSRVV